MFLDEVVLDVGSGNGGRGAVSFRREKYVPHGGPDGGDGGCGGSVIMIGDPQLSTLGDYRRQRHFTAGNGGQGGGTHSSGRDAEDLLLAVPLGTVVRDAENGEEIADLVDPGQRVIVAAGGRGGRGNARFKSATRQAPRLSDLGEKGKRRRLQLELKLIADIGLVGLPNAGKSTLLAALTGARPKIAAYPFTTLSPNLGVAETADSRALVIADVPGLIEGAHLGAGLGMDFLRHLDRTRVLIHLVDASVGEEVAVTAVEQVLHELEAFNTALAAKPRLLAANKIDEPGAVQSAARLAAHFPGAHAIAGRTGEGCAELFDAAAVLVAAARAEAVRAALTAPPGQPSGAHRVYRHQHRPQGLPAVIREDDAYRVVGDGVERMVAMTDLSNEESLARLQRRLRSAGVDAALATAGAVDGDTVRIGEAEFDYDAEDG